LELFPAGKTVLPETVRNELTYLSLSEAPQAEPQADVTDVSFQPIKFESAIF